MKKEVKTVESKIISQVAKKKKGTIFFAEDFYDAGNEAAIRQALVRMVNKGIIERIAQGIYVIPKQDPRIGTIRPTLDDIAKAIARRDKAKIVPTGHQALNLLGLSTQVPLNTIYLSDGAARKIQVGNRKINFKRTTPKNLAAKGDISGLVIQALRAIGKDKETNEERFMIVELLKKEEKDRLIHDIKLAPAWMAKIMKTALISET